MHHKTKHSMNVLGAFAAGALTTALVGGYFLFGPNGRKNRRRVDNWIARAKFEIKQKVRQTKNLTQDVYDRIVDEVTSKYGHMEDVGREKAENLADELKAHWKNFDHPEDDWDDPRDRHI